MQINVFKYHSFEIMLRNSHMLKILNSVVEPLGTGNHSVNNNYVLLKLKFNVYSNTSISSDVWTKTLVLSDDATNLWKLIKFDFWAALSHRGPAQYQKWL